MRKSRKQYALIDEPTPYDILENWERHLSDLKQLPADTMLKPQMIKDAKETIARKKAEARKVSAKT